MVIAVVFQGGIEIIFRFIELLTQQLVVHPCRNSIR